MRSKHLTIGETIAALEAAEYGKDADILFDFGAFAPYRAASYRGFYNQLALGFGPTPPRDDYDARRFLRSPAAVIQELTQAIGKVYEGYKGGEFLMTAETPLWVSNVGDADGTGVIGVRSLDWRVIIETRYVDEDENTYQREEMVLRSLLAARTGVY